jgi:transcriptional regulator with XRE-family HTH domain
MSDRRPTELAEFLAVRRARLTPQDVGLDGPPARRRVPGLRREELARLAGVSVDYYTRLEQGRSRSASAEVLDALATALQLNDAERQHLHLLAKPQPAQRKRRSRPQSVDPATLRLLDLFDQAWSAGVRARPPARCVGAQQIGRRADHRISGTGCPTA